MKEEKVEELILGIDKNETSAWEKMNKEWKSGALIMPDEEIKRRKAYKENLAEIFRQNRITTESFPEDSWLCGKIARILEV